MSQLWTIVEQTGGAVLCPSFETDSFGQHPKDKGWAWNAATQRAVRIDARPDVLVQSFSGTVWAEDAAKVEALLIPKVKAANEALVRGLYSTNFGKQKKYSRKQQEVLDYRALSGTVSGLTSALASTVLTLPLATMTLAQQRKKFRFAMAQAKKRGVSLDVIIGEFEAAIDDKEEQVANWEAVELEAVRAIKAAPTAADKRAVFAAINWGWSA